MFGKDDLVEWHPDGFQPVTRGRVESVVNGLVTVVYGPHEDRFTLTMDDARKILTVYERGQSRAHN